MLKYGFQYFNMLQAKKFFAFPNDLMIKNIFVKICKLDSHALFSYVVLLHFSFHSPETFLSNYYEFVWRDNLSFKNQINSFLSLIDFLMEIYDSTNNFIEENLFRRQREKEFERESI